MKILIVTQYFYPEIFRVNTLCEELVKRGHDVTVLTGYPQYPEGKIFEGYGFSLPYETEYKGAKVHRIKVLPRGKTPIGLLMNCISFVIMGNSWVRKCSERFDTIYVYGLSPITVGLPAVKYKEKFATPIYFNVQDLWPESVESVLKINDPISLWILNKIVDKIYGASDRILCSSQSFILNIASRGVPKEKLLFWPQFCAEPDFVGAEKPNCYNDENFNIVFTGNIGRAQGLDLLADTAQKLKSTPVRWYIVGDGRARKQLEKRVKAMGLDNIITFVGRVTEAESNIYTRYADCAYLSFLDSPLFDMTIPAKLQSYMACGTPILAAAGGESAEIIKSADCGFICDKNADKLADMIKEKVMSCTSLDEMGLAGRKYYSEHFTVDFLLDEFEKILDESKGTGELLCLKS